MNLKTIKFAIIAGMFTLSASQVVAQQKTAEHKNADVRLAQKSLENGDFKTAEKHLLKALPTESKDPSVLYMLGYSQFQNGAYKEAQQTLSKVVALDPKYADAYYLKGKASANLIATSTTMAAEQRTQLLNSSIEDYSKAIAANPKDAKYYQNRATSYRDLGILVGTVGKNNYNKAAATQAYNNAVKDYEKVLTFDATRKDIQTEIKKAKVYRDNLK